MGVKKQPGTQIQITVCPECFGRGRDFLHGETCKVCHGTGRVTEETKMEIERANEPQDWRLAEAVLAIKIDELSPMDAMTKLYELKRLAQQVRGEK
jgi:RecJ-like exonuclease